MNFWKTAGLAVAAQNNNEGQTKDVVASLIKNGISIIALADGATESQHSLEGATIVANAICKYISNNFIKMFNDESELEIKREILDDILHRLNKRAKRLKCDVNELSSNLIFVVVKEDSQYMIGHIGDGCIVSKDKNGWGIVTLEDKQKSSNNDYVTSPNIFAIMKLHKGDLNPGASCFAIMSKGSEASLIDRTDAQNVKVANAVSLMSNWMKSNSTEEVDKALKNAMENKIAKMSQDDCSIAFLTKVKIETNYDELDYEAKQDIFEKHYTHLYNVEAAIEDANFILNVLKTTNATSLYISKKSKVKQATCNKILDILYKAGYLSLDTDIYSLISKQDMISE